MRLAALAFAALALAAAGAERKHVSPSRLWEGEFSDENLRRLRPKGGVITEAKTFAKVWKAWRPEEKVPEVDFAEELAVAVWCGKGARPVTSVVLRDGQLSVIRVTARRGRGG
jgi:hypothetical protein